MFSSHLWRGQAVTPTLQRESDSLLYMLEQSSLNQQTRLDYPAVHFY